MIKSTLLGLAGACWWAGTAAAAEPESCKTVRFSDVGWTDITATTALASVVLEGLGYEPTADILSVPVTYQSLKNGDIDVFLGNWMPTMEADIAPFKEDGSVEVVARQPRGREVHAGRAQVPRRRGPQGLRRHRQVQGPARRQDLRHRARQRRQPPDPEDDRRRPVRPRRASRWSRAPSRACWPRSQRAVARQRADRVPGLGAAPDERQLRARLPRPAATRCSAPISAAPRSTPTSARATCRSARTSASCCRTSTFTLPMESEIMGGILDDGKDAEDAAERVAEGQSRARSTAGSPA